MISTHRHKHSSSSLYSNTLFYVCVGLALLCIKPVSAAGVLNPLCDQFFLEYMFLVGGWLALAAIPILIGFFISQFFLFWQRYQSCYIPGYVPGRWVFFFGWLGVYLAAGAANFLVYFYQGRTCESYIPLLVGVTWPLWGIVWPALWPAFGSPLYVIPVWGLQVLHLVAWVITLAVISPYVWAFVALGVIAVWHVLMILVFILFVYAVYKRYRSFTGAPNRVFGKIMEIIQSNCDPCIPNPPVGLADFNCSPIDLNGPPGGLQAGADFELQQNAGICYTGSQYGQPTYRKSANSPYDNTYKEIHPDEYARRIR